MPISVSDMMKDIGKDAFHNVTRDTQRISNPFASTALRDAMRSVENIAGIAADVNNNSYLKSVNDERVKHRPAIQQWVVCTP